MSSSKQLKIDQLEKDLNLLEGLEQIVPKKRPSVKKPAAKKPVAVTQKKPVAEKKLIVGKEPPVEKKEQSKMYIDFSPIKIETSENKPTKLSLIIQLTGLLSALLPNRELLQSLIKLVKVFISVAFTLSAVYASAKIYANIFEWLFTLFNQLLKKLFRVIQFYLPEILNIDIVRKALSFLIGVDISAPATTHPYVPNFLYSIWITTKFFVLSKPVLKFFLGFIFTVLVISIVIKFLAYASELPGHWIKKIALALRNCVYAFFIKCRDLFFWFLSFFSGKNPGTGWLSLFWIAQSAAEKIQNDEILQLWGTVTTSREKLSEITEKLESIHEDLGGEPDQYYLERRRIDQLVADGWASITAFMSNISHLRLLVEKSNNRSVVRDSRDLIFREEELFKQHTEDFRRLSGLFGYPTAQRPNKKDKKDGDDGPSSSGSVGSGGSDIPNNSSGGFAAPNNPSNNSLNNPSNNPSGGFGASTSLFNSGGDGSDTPNNVFDKNKDSDTEKKY